MISYSGSCRHRTDMIVPNHPMSRTGGTGALLVMAGVLGALPPVGYLER